MERLKTTFRTTARRGLITRACGVSIPESGTGYQVPGTRGQGADAGQLPYPDVTSCSTAIYNHGIAYHATALKRPVADHGKPLNPLSANTSHRWNMPVGPVRLSPGRCDAAVKALRNIRNSIRDSIRRPSRIQSRIDLRTSVVGCPMKDAGSSPVSGFLICSIRMIRTAGTWRSAVAGTEFHSEGCEQSKSIRARTPGTHAGMDARTFFSPMRRDRASLEKFLTILATAT